MTFCESTLLIMGNVACLHLPANTCTCVHVVSVSVFSFSIKSQRAQIKRKTEIY